MLHDTSTPPSIKSRMGAGTYTNAALTAIAVLLGLNIIGGFSASRNDAGVSGFGPASADAQPLGSSEGGGLVSAADQRKVMIGELRELSRRMDALHQRLSRPIDVKVVEMPAVKIAGDRERERERRAESAAPAGVPQDK